ncbi:WhiB family transcriptional regulator [Streptomyces sp. PA03-1a]|nr:WhiB family transcriptional regulator [Streptomyces sp. PA03-1a]MDX2813350.1 WhiB family transcriptional regulator [Streptomyces sp. PA03-5A]
MPRPSRYAPDTTDRPPHWSDDAECQNHEAPDMWFAERESDPLAVLEAKRLCGRCSCRLPCLGRALDTGDPWGIWGGLDPDERRALSSSSRTAA